MCDKNILRYVKLHRLYICNSDFVCNNLITLLYRKNSALIFAAMRKTVVFIVLILLQGGEADHTGDMRTLTTLFNQCHFKITMRVTATDTLTLDTSLPRLHEFHDDVVISIQKIQEFEYGSDTSRIVFRIQLGSSCFVHVYMEVDLSNLGTDYTELELLMSHHRHTESWPHHFIFAGNFEKYSEDEEDARLSFYRERLHYTPARGLILALNFNTTSKLKDGFTAQIICPFCRTVVKPLHLRKIVNPDTSAKQFHRDWLGTDNRGLYVGNIRKNEISEMELTCNITYRDAPPKSTTQLTSSICVFHILASKFNFTFSKGNKFKNKGFSFIEASPRHSLSAINIQRHSNAKLSLWVSYGFVQAPMKFITFQTRPLVSLEKLLFQPYDIPTWILVFISAAIFAVILLPGSPKGVWEIILSLLFSCLEQSVELRLTQKNKASLRAQHLCWAVWTLIMIVISNGYKGKIFALLTKVEKVDWPGNVKDLAGDASITMLSCEVFYGRKYGSKGTYPLLEMYFDEHIVKNGTWEEYFTLKQSKIQLYVRNPMIVTGDIIHQSVFSRNRVQGEFLVGNVSSPKFAFIYREQDISFIHSVVSNIIASRSNEIHGFDLWMPWAIGKNYFHDTFTDVLGALEQTGFLLAFERHKQFVAGCASIHEIDQYLRTTYNVTNEYANPENCILKSVAEWFAGVSIEQDSEPAALNLLQINGLFKILSAIIAGTLIVFLSEVCISQLLG